MNNDLFEVGDKVTRKNINAFRYGQQHSTIQDRYLVKINQHGK